MWKKIKKEMDKQGMNQNQLSIKMGVHSGILSDLKNGRIKKPSFELMCKIANALNVSLDKFK